MITVGKNQTKIIPIDLGWVSLSSSRKRGSRTDNWIPDQVGNDRKIEVILVGENASVEVVGLVIGSGSDEKSLEAYITHAAPNTKSNVNVRAVLRGKSSFDFRGNVKIEKGAKGSNAYLRSDVLLFDDAKMGDDTPALEILEPDVKAGHAATVGKVDEQMLFYLMSRGLSKKQAESMLVEGFINPIKNILRAQREVTSVIPAKAGIQKSSGSSNQVGG